jgi:hypothetical protein
MARATAVLIALTASTFVVAAIEGAVIPKSIVGAVDGLPGQSASGAARDDGVMETLTRMTAGATKWRLRMVRCSSRTSHHRKRGGNRGDQTAECATSRRTLRQCPNYAVKLPVIHRTHLQTRRGRSM